MRAKRDKAVQSNLIRVTALREGKAYVETHSRIGFLIESIRFIVIWNLFIDINFFLFVY